MNPLVDKNVLWLCWHLDAQWKGWWWLSCDCSLSSYRDPGSYVPLSADQELSLQFSVDPGEVLVHLWTNAPTAVALEVFRADDPYEGPLKISNDDDIPVMCRLPAHLGSSADRLSYSIKGGYRDPFDHRLHSADPKFTISRSG